jgi:hypothetical protein
MGSSHDFPSICVISFIISQHLLLIDFENAPKILLKIYTQLNGPGPNSGNSLAATLMFHVGVAIT